MIEDLDIFTNGLFGQLVTIDGLQIVGIFDENFDVYGLGNVNAEGKNITLLVQTSQVVNVAHGSSVTIGTRYFEVVGIQPIDDGKLTNLVLKEN